MDCWEFLTSDENLRVAYRRARRELESFEGLVDHEEFAAWENDLDWHLAKVRKLLLKTCEQVPCNLTPVPKREGKARAYYSIPLEYQVGWLAIVEAIGPLLDKRMPNWSFAYRLHRPRIRTPEGKWPWDEHRTSSEEIYLGFARSWKPFRRYANLTLKRFLGDEKHADDMAEAEIDRLEQELPEGEWTPEPQQNLDVDLRTRRFPYFEKNWPSRLESRVWFARLDIENFFPSVKRAQLPDILVAELAGLRGFSNPERWYALFTVWLNFIELPSQLKADQLNKQRIASGGLPVGLIAAGFLANVFMLRVDRELERVIQSQYSGRVAVLRYVDDFIVLAGSQEELAAWLRKFIDVLNLYGFKLASDEKKVNPEVLVDVIKRMSREPYWDPTKQNLKKLLKGKFGRWGDEGTVTRFDRKEFISTTLQRMSFRAAEDPDMLDESELDYRFLDLLDLAAAGSTNAEVHQETLHAFSAGQLQRTPLCSPAPFLATSSAKEQDNELLENLQLVNERIRHRGMMTVRQLLVAVTSAPHKHRLIGRCVQVATEFAQFLPAESPDLIILRDTFRQFLQLLSGTKKAAEPLSWQLGENTYRPLRSALLSFLRMRFWNAVSDELLKVLRALEFLPNAEKPVRSNSVPNRTERLRRALDWLHTQADWLHQKCPIPAESQIGFLSTMETGARNRWQQIDTLVRAYRTEQGELPPIDRASPTPSLLVEYGRLLSAWSGPEQKGHLATAAKRTLRRWVIRSLKDRTRWTPGEHRLICKWLLQNPQKRLGKGRIVQRLINEQAKWQVASDSPTPAACKWLRELFWSYAALPDRERYFDIINGLSLQSLDGTDIKKLVGSIEGQVGSARTPAPPDKKTWCSLQYLMEAEIWGTGRLRDRTQPTLLDAPETLRVFLLVSLLTWVQKEARPGSCIALDNLFVRYSSFIDARKKIASGRQPESLPIRYELVLRDRFFEIDTKDSAVDASVVAGLLGIQLVAGPRALDHVLKRRPRRQIDAQDVLLAFEDAPAVSREVVGIVAGLCMFPRWQRIHDNRPIVATYKELLGVLQLRTLDDAVTAANKAFRHLFKNCTQRDGKASYLITPGIGQGLAETNQKLPALLKVGLIQPNLDLIPRKHWDYSARRLRMSEEFAEFRAWPAIWHGLRAVRAGIRDANASRNTPSPPAIVLIPELMVPRRRVTHLKRYAQRENMIIVAGVEYRSASYWARNEAVVIIPAEDRTQTASARCFWIGKRYPAPNELESLEQYEGLRFVTSQDLTAINTKLTGTFGVGVCYDLYAVQTLVGFQGRILHLFIAAYNRDIQTFDSLGDAAMRLLYCNVVIANGGTYGGSVAVSPYYDPHMREVLRIRGQGVDAAENFRLPLEPLRAAQHGLDPPKPSPQKQKKTRLFKHRPADWPK